MYQAGIREELMPMAVHERHHCMWDFNMELLSQGEFIRLKRRVAARAQRHGGQLATTESRFLDR
jgi:hypothetical protein